MEDLLGILAGIGLLLLCIHVRNWRSESHQRHCPKCGTLTNANGASSGMRYSGGGYIHNYHCRNCGHKWSD